jgi:hypothetical protein
MLQSIYFILSINSGQDCNNIVFISQYVQDYRIISAVYDTVILQRLRLRQK